MLYYERVVHSRPGIYPLHSSPRSSEETLRPKHSNEGVNGSTASLESVMDSREERSLYGARIVRSVAAGRGRSASAAPSERGSTTDPLPNGNGFASSSAILLNGNLSHSSLTLKAPVAPSTPTKPSKVSNLSASAPDLRERSVSVSSARPSTSQALHCKSTQPVQPSPIADLKA